MPISFGHLWFTFSSFDDCLWGLSLGEAYSSWVGAVIKLGHVTKPGQAGFHSGLGLWVEWHRTEDNRRGQGVTSDSRSRNDAPKGWLHQASWGQTKALDFILNAKETCKAILSTGRIFLWANQCHRGKATQQTIQSNEQCEDLWSSQFCPKLAPGPWEFVRLF